MKSKRLLTAGALLGAISFATPLFAKAESNSVKGGAQTVCAGYEADTEDGDLTAKIRTALAIDPITKNAKIHVATAHAIVTLTGDVQNETVIEEAKQVAQNTDRVKLVLNNLKVENVSNATFEM